MSIKIKVPRLNFGYDPYKDDGERFKGKSGIYYIYSEKDSDELLYIGKTNDLYKRMRSHFFIGKEFKDYRHDFGIVVGFFCDCQVERDIYETYLINELKPLLNRDKVYKYQSLWDNDRFFTDKELKRREKQREKMAQISYELDL